MVMPHRLVSLALALPLFLLSLQGGSMACLQASAHSSDHVHASQLAGAHGGAMMAGMHHAMAMDGASEGQAEGADATPAPDDHDRGPHAPCPEQHSLGSCASMPSCAPVSALPAIGAASPPMAEGARVALAAASAPRAWVVAPELPPPRG